VALLFNIACIANTDLFQFVTELTLDEWERTDVTALQLIDSYISRNSSAALGVHEFVPNPAGSGVPLPQFDFRMTSVLGGNPKAFIIAVKIGDILAPSPSTDVDWVELKGVQGELATTVIRINTAGGQPPASVRDIPLQEALWGFRLDESLTVMQCKPGSPDISVKYSAAYGK